MTGKVLVAGVGNIFLSDDGFGVEVINQLTSRVAAESTVLPDDVELLDVGIRGMHLAYQLLDGYRALVLVDATQRGGEPGTLYLLEHDMNAPAESEGFDAHGMDPGSVLAQLGELSRAVSGGSALPLDRVLVVGCEPAQLDEGMGLSPPVAAAVDAAVRTVTEIVSGMLAGEGDRDAGSTAVWSRAGGSRSPGAGVAAGSGEVSGNPGDVTLPAAGRD